MSFRRDGRPSETTPQRERRAAVQIRARATKPAAPTWRLQPPARAWGWVSEGCLVSAPRRPLPWAACGCECPALPRGGPGWCSPPIHAHACGGQFDDQLRRYLRIFCFGGIVAPDTRGGSFLHAGRDINHFVLGILKSNVPNVRKTPIRVGFPQTPLNFILREQ